MSAEEIAAAIVCPDCNAEKALDRDAFGVWHLVVLHDDSCPTLKEIQR